MKKVGEKNGFVIYWCCDTQTYTVYKDGKFLTTNKYKFSDVQTYIS